MKFIARCCVILSLLCAASGNAASEIAVTNAWIRATPPGQKTAAAYFDIRSAEAAALVAASTPVAQHAQLHTMRMTDGIMRMRPVNRIELAPGKPVQLAPGGLHLMLTDLKHPLKAGDRVPIRLTVQPGSGAPVSVNVEAEVRPIGARSSPSAPAHQH